MSGVDVRGRAAAGPQDNLDQEIVRLLKADGRATNKWIAQKLQVSEPTIAQRIRRMVEGGQMRVIAQQIISRTSPSSLTTIIEIFLDRFDALDAAAKALAEIPEVLTVYSTQGRPELVAHFWSENRASLTETVWRLSRDIPHVKQLNVMPVLELRLFRSEYGDLAASYGALWPRSEGSKDAMLQLLSETARQSIRALALQLGVPESTARSQLSAITKDKSIRFGAVLDARHAGRTVWADIRLSINPHLLDEAMVSLASRENLSLVAYIAGHENLALFCIEESIAGLNRFIDEAVRNLPGLENFRVLRVPKVFSHNHHYAL